MKPRTNLAAYARLAAVLLVATATPQAYAEHAATDEAAPNVLAFVGATIHPVSSPPIEDGLLVVEGHAIRHVGPAGEPPAGARVIDAAGTHLYPGIIAPYTHLGLVEIEAVRATRDFAETGAINPNAMAHKAFNPDSELIGVTRSNGILLALTAPLSGRVPGTSSLMQLDGWTWEEMLVQPAVGMHLNWPPAKPRRRFGRGDDDDKKQDQPDPIAQLDDLFDKAAAYAAEREAAGPGAPPLGVDLRLEAMLPVIRGERKLIVTAEGQAEIEAAVAFCVRRGLKMILHGGYDAPRCAALLKEHGVPVIVGGVYRLPRRRHEPYDHAYTVPARLHEAGVPFCIAASDTFLASNARNLPYHAAMAAGFGLPADEALKSITLHAAEILGVADRVGSLEPGKHATLILTDGDPLETTTQVQRAFVQGAEVNLTDRHKQLYQRYRQRPLGKR
ncbi:MAG: amidohydrolase family protein [Planctomycetota bacterium]